MKEFGLIIKLVLSIVFIMLFGDGIPEWMQRAFFTLSIFMKETLIFCMPLIVFAFIFSCLSSFQKKAPLLIVMILSFVVASNFLFTQVGYLSGDIGLPYLGYHAANAVQQTASTLPQLTPFFTVPYPRLISTDIALLVGTLAGLYGAFWGNDRLVAWGDVLKNKVQGALTKVFIPLVPLYVIGFLLKIHHDESLVEMFTGYGPMIGLIVVMQVISMLFFYFKANLGNIKHVKNSLKNVFPSGLVAMSTMSSAATLPLTLEAAEKNTKNKAVAQFVIPATVNIHHVGDSVAVPLLIAAVYAINGFDPMSYSTFLLFSMYYMVAKFAVASVPGGEIIVLLPILESHFGFTDSMCGLITTLYILCDPFITTTNVLSNGALAILMDKVCGRIKAFKEPKSAVQDASL
ncbi:MAG: cation:dicarboxylase symporter family transporter [Proteobacteria bacterium]|nr:cation:dicarboxylase symporter family transporter [Pseudomonadota bacterium]